MEYFTSWLIHVRDCLFIPEPLILITISYLPESEFNSALRNSINTFHDTNTIPMSQIYDLKTRMEIHSFSPYVSDLCAQIRSLEQTTNYSDHVAFLARKVRKAKAERLPKDVVFNLVSDFANLESIGPTNYDNIVRKRWEKLFVEMSC